MIFGEKGYPTARVLDQDINKTYLATVLTNTVIDPLINKLLINFGFNFQKYIDKAIKIQIPMLEGYPDEIDLHLFDRHMIICLLIKNTKMEIIR